jgi:hypothetical protein
MFAGGREFNVRLKITLEGGNKFEAKDLYCDCHVFGGGIICYHGTCL